MKIRFRKPINGPESKLVDNFLKNIDDFIDTDFNYLVLIEPYAEVGIPDILIVMWEKKAYKKWPPERFYLVKKDMKIMHHISSFGRKGVKKSNLIKQLGYTEKILTLIIQKLINADLVKEKGEFVYSKDLKNNFFIRRIVTIEAKVTNFKKAILQAELNENFSSHSYVLLPNAKITSKVKSQFKRRVGLLGQEGEKIIFEKKAKKIKLPGSYFSWVINEYIGRQLTKTKYNV